MKTTHNNREGTSNNDELNLNQSQDHILALLTYCGNLLQEQVEPLDHLEQDLRGGQNGDQILEAVGKIEEDRIIEEQFIGKI